MAIYEYVYTRALTQEGVVVERIFRMGEAPDTIEVVDEQDGQTYTARRIISQTAKMAGNWARGRPVSDLPDEKHPLID